MSMKIVTALVGVILLVSGIVLGASAGQLPVFSFIAAEEQTAVAPQTSPPVSSLEGLNSRLRAVPQAAQQGAVEALYRIRRRTMLVFAPLTGDATRVAQQVVIDARCEDLPPQGVDWSDCPAKAGISLNGSNGDSLQDANLQNTAITASTLINVSMANAQINNLDLSTSFMVGLDLTGATGTPLGANVFLLNTTCPDGAFLANHSGDMASACSWLTDAEPSSTPTHTPTATATTTDTTTPTATATATSTATSTATATATSEAEPSSTPTATATSESEPSSTPTATATEAPLDCWEGIINGGFEVVDAWYTPATSFTAVYSQEQANGGAWSMRTGISESGGNVYSFSSARQRLELPAGTTPLLLRFSLYPQTSEPASFLIPTSIREALNSLDSNLGDAQWVIIYDSRGRELERLVSMRSDARQWQPYEFDLSAHAGQTIEIYFGTFNSGTGGVTALYVDDVSLSSCQETPQETFSFLPAQLGDVPVGLSGRVLNDQGTPEAGVQIDLFSDQSRVSATTDASGYYAFDELEPLAYEIYPPQPNGAMYEPAEYLVDVPPSQGGLNFTMVTPTPDPYP